MNIKLGLGLGSSLFKETVQVDGVKYAVLNTIGEGGFAFVYRVKRIQKASVFGGGKPAAEGNMAEKHYALKKMICQTDEQVEEANTEIAVMQAVSHVNILPFLGQSRVVNKKHQTEISLLLPLYTGGSVEGLIANGKGFPHCPFATGDDVLNVIRGTIAGLKALHAAGYRHNDLKPANILLQEKKEVVNGAENLTWHAVLTDFGSTGPLVVEVKTRAQALDVQDFHNTHSTASIKAPELFDPPSSGLVIDGRADVWGLGATMFAILYSRTPFESPKEGFSSLAALSGAYTIPPGHPFGKPIEAVLAMCLTSAPTGRATLDSVEEAVTALPPAPGSLVHVFPPEVERKPMPLWSPGDASVSHVTSTSSSASSPTRPQKQAPVPAPVVDWGEANFDADFSNADIPAPDIVNATASSGTAGGTAADSTEGKSSLGSALSAEFDATFSFEDAGAGLEESDADDDFDDFGDFTSAEATPAEAQRRRSSGNTGSGRMSAGQVAQVQVAAAAAQAAGDAGLKPPSPPPSDGTTNDSGTNSPRISISKANRARLKSVESGVSSDGEGRPSDVDEFGDNERFSSYAAQTAQTEGRLSLSKLRIASKSESGTSNNPAEDKDSKAEAAPPTRLSGSGPGEDDEFGAFEDF